MKPALRRSRLPTSSWVCTRLSSSVSACSLSLEFEGQNSETCSRWRESALSIGLSADLRVTPLRAKLAAAVAAARPHALLREKLALPRVGEGGED